MYVCLYILAAFLNTYLIEYHRHFLFTWSFTGV